MFLRTKSSYREAGILCFEDFDLDKIKVKAIKITRMVFICSVEKAKFFIKKHLRTITKTMTYNRNIYL